MAETQPRRQFFYAEVPNVRHATVAMVTTITACLSAVAHAQSARKHLFFYYFGGQPARVLA